MQPQAHHFTVLASSMSDLQWLLAWLSHHDVFTAGKDRFSCPCSGPDSPPESDSEASDHGARAEGGQQGQAAPRKPSVEREDWMTKAMPKSAPGADKEAAGAAEEEAVKKVAAALLWNTMYEQSPQSVTRLRLLPR